MSEQTIVLVVDEDSDDYDDSVKLTVGQTTVIIAPLGDDGEYLRGYEADVVMTPEDTPRSVYTEVLRPMCCLTDGEIVTYE